MTLENVLGMSGALGIVALIIVGILWFVLTIFILCIMEVRSFRMLMVFSRVVLVLATDPS